MSVGVGDVQIIGYTPIVEFDGVTNVSPGVADVQVAGYGVTVQDSINVSVGVGDVSVDGAAPSVPLVIQAGAGDISIDGYSVTAVPELGIVGTTAGVVVVIGQRIGLSTPEKASSPSVGDVSLVGASPNVIVTGYWDKQDRSTTTWGKEAEASESWVKVANGSDSWTKI